MSITINMHDVVSVAPGSAITLANNREVHWIDLRDAKGNVATIFLPAAAARAMADAFNAARQEDDK